MSVIGLVMKKKLNCWEYKKCGRQPGGVNLAEFSVCPAATEKKANGFNGGKNAGRICWAIAYTLCDEKNNKTNAEKLSNCMECDFFKLVSKEEGFNFKSIRDILPKLKK